MSEFAVQLEEAASRTTLVSMNLHLLTGQLPTNTTRLIPALLPSVANLGQVKSLRLWKALRNERTFGRCVADG